MKNSRQYSQKILKLYRSLKRKYGKVKKRTFDSPTDTLVYAVLCEYFTESESQSAVRKLESHFVDWNDLRVSRPDEIIETIGRDVSQTKSAVLELVKVLNSVFNQYNCVIMDNLLQMGKRQARQMLEKMNAVSKFVVDYIMLFALEGHAVPLTAGMIAYLKANQLVHSEAEYTEIAEFLEKQIPASGSSEFYSFLRTEAEKAEKADNKTQAKAAAKQKADGAV